MSDEPEATANEADISKEAVPALASSLPGIVAPSVDADTADEPAPPQSQRDTPRQPAVADEEPATIRPRIASQTEIEEVRRPGPAMINPDANVTRRARARMTLRIPDDNVPVSRTPSSPDLEAHAAAAQRTPSSPELEAMAGPAAMIRAMRIISVGESPAAPPSPTDLSPIPAPAFSPPGVVRPVLAPIAPPVITQAAAPVVAPAAADEHSEALTPDDIVADMLAMPPAGAELPAFDSPALGPTAGSAGALPAPVSGVIAVTPPEAASAADDEVELTEEELTPDSSRDQASEAPGPSPKPPAAEARAAFSSTPSSTEEEASREPLPSFEVPVELEEDAAAGPAPEESPAGRDELPPPRAAMPALELNAPDFDAAATPFPVDRPAPQQSQPEVSLPVPIEFPAVPVEFPAAPPIVGASVSRVPSAPSNELPPPVLPRAVSPAPPLVQPIASPAAPDDVEVAEVEVVEEVGAPKRPAPVPPAPPPPKPKKDKPAEVTPAQKPAAATSLSQPPRARVRPWWEELFTDDFVRSMDKLTGDQVNREVKFIEESLAVQKGGVMLDLGCGTGQHAVELAARGYSVVGYDLSLTMLALAADEAQNRGQKLNFLQGDMREMAFEEMFDGVFSWSTSFGYFDHDKNCEVLRRVQRALRTGGMFLLDVVNRDFLISRTPTMGWFEGDGCVCMDEAKFDCITSRLMVKRTLMLDDGRAREIEFSIRLYSLHEIGKMVNDAGFKVVDVSGHPATAGVFMGAESPRLITLAEKR